MKPRYYSELTPEEQDRVMVQIALGEELVIRKLAGHERVSALLVVLRRFVAGELNVLETLLEFDSTSILPPKP